MYIKILYLFLSILLSFSALAETELTIYAKSKFSLDDIGSLNPIDSPIDGYDKDNTFYPDPFGNDEILFSINSNNYSDYIEYLTLSQCS